MITLQTFVFNPFYENTYLIWNEQNEAVILDPGCYDEEEREVLRNFIRDKELTPVAVLNTHCHIDHILGNAFVMREWGIPLLAPTGEVSAFESVMSYGPGMGIFPEQSPPAQQLLKGGDKLELIGLNWEVLSVPGHSPDGMCFYLKDQALLFAGDVLFRESIGRTDLPGGNLELLLSGIRGKLFSLPESTLVLPGHGDSTDINHERKNNPFLSGKFG
jgi:hydroxyacylglutathione hydrolase